MCVDDYLIVCILRIYQPGPGPEGLSRVSLVSPNSYDSLASLLHDWLGGYSYYAPTWPRYVLEGP